MIWPLTQLLALFDDLIWFDTKNVELKLKFSSNNWLSFFNSVVWIEFVKDCWIEKWSIQYKKSISETFSRVEYLTGYNLVPL